MGPQKRTLRASCDNCHKIKVRCVPTPTAGCQRCQSLNARCVHSPPGRSGRAPGSKKTSSSSQPSHDNDNHDNNHDDDQTDPTRTPSASCDGNGDEDNNGGEMQSSFTGIDFTADLAILDDTRNPADLDDAALLSSWFSIISSSSSPSSSSPSSSSSTALSNPPHENPQHGWMLGELPLTPATPALSIATPILSSMSDFVTGDQPPAVRRTSSTTIPLTTMPLLRPQSSTSNPCICFQFIVRTLEKIQQTNVRLLGLDVVLTQNKEALIHICNSLKCTFPHDSTTRLLIVVLLRKSLHLYHLLYRSRLKNKWDLPGGCDSPAAFLSPPPDPYIAFLHQHQDGSFRECQNRQDNIARLTMGTYQLDAADESSLKRQILILDVGKVPRLLERLDRRACGLDEDDGLDLYNIMRSSLIADFGAIMAEVQT